MPKATSSKACLNQQIPLSQRDSSRAAFSIPGKIFPIEDPKVGFPEKKINEAGKRQIEDIVGDILNESEASVRSAAKECGLRVVTENQFKIMEWGTRQLKILRLQEECDRILKDIR